MRLRCFWCTFASMLPDPDLSDRDALEAACEVAGVSCDDVLIGRLQTYINLLRTWQKAKNLVSAETLDSVVERHVADSLQIVPLIHRRLGAISGITAPIGLDFGSGAGLPGAIIALAAHVAFMPSMTLVEANGRRRRSCGRFHVKRRPPFTCKTVGLKRLMRLRCLQLLSLRGH